MIVVSNTTPLIGLAVVERFDLLQAIFRRISIPQAVYNETVVVGREKRGAKRELETANWVRIVTVQNQVAVEALLDELHRAEAEVIVLAQELGADWVLMDEKKGRRKTAELGLNTIGTLGLLLKAKQMGLLTEIAPHVDLLRRQGFSISDQVVRSVLERAGESPRTGGVGSRKT